MAGGTHPATDVHNFIGLCTTADTPPCDVKSNFDASRITDVETDKGDVNINGYEDFYITTSSNSISVGRQGEATFMSLSVSTNDAGYLDPHDIRFVGFDSHDGTDGATYDEDSDWRFCTGTWYKP